MSRRINLLPTPQTLDKILSYLDINFKRIVDAFALSGTPTGAVIPYAGSAAPSGFLLADGASYLRVDYPQLFTEIGTTYGAADADHFNVPDLKGRVLVGRDSGQVEFDTLGESGGVKTHTLVTGEMPSHNHTQDAHGHQVDFVGLEGGVAGHNHDTSGNALSAAISDIGGRTGGTTTGNVAKNITPTNQATGGGGAHQNLQPYRVLNYIIKT